MKAAKIILKTAMVTTLSFMMVSIGLKTPAVAISDYFEEVKKGDRNNELLKLKGGKSAIQMGESNEEISDVAKRLLSQSLKQIKYTINNENVEGERAVVNVTVKGPNITNGMVNTIQESFKKILEKSNLDNFMSDEDGKRIVDDVMKKNFNQLKVDERTADIILRKNNNRWTVEDNEELCNLILGNGYEI